MRISKTWFRPILTAVLFPGVLIGIMWALDEYGQWRAERLVNVSRQQAISLAWSKCFSNTPPGFPAVKWAYARIAPQGWIVTSNQSYFDWLLQREPSVVAWVATQQPIVLGCQIIGPRF